MKPSRTERVARDRAGCRIKWREFRAGEGETFGLRLH